MTGIELFAIAGTAFTLGDAMLVAGTVATAAGVLSAGQQQAAQTSQYQQYQAEIATRNAQAADYNAKVAQQEADFNRQLLTRNAQIERLNAAQATSEGEAEASRLDRQRRVLLSTQIATASANGSLTGSGFDVISDDAIEGALNVVNAKYAGQMEARRYILSAQNYDLQALSVGDPSVPYLYQAENYRTEAKAHTGASVNAAKSSPGIGSVSGTLLTGFGKVGASKITSSGLAGDIQIA